MSTTDVPDTIEYRRDQYLDATMANLTLGAVPPSTNMSRYGGKERRMWGMKNIDKRTGRYPEFWRKTLANKILEHKNKNNKTKISYEVLRPSKLQYIQFPPHTDQNPTVAVTLSEETSEYTGKRNLALRPSHSLADFTGLKIDSQTDHTIPGTKTKSTMSLTRLSALQWVKKLPKWKSRGKSSLKEYRVFPSLPTIAEDTPEGQLVGPLKNVSLNTQGQPNSNTPQSCSQQALTENGPCDDITIDELASYLDLLVHIPKKMSPMAEMMYT